MQLIASLSVGGAEQLLLGLADQIDRERFELHVCSLGTIRGNRLLPEFERLDLPIRIFGLERWYDPRALAMVVRYARTHRIDVIHTHLVHPDIMGNAAGMALGLPVATTLHNVPHNYRRERVNGVIERFVFRNLATQLIAVSTTIHQAFIHEWGIPAEKITTIPNAVQLERFLAVQEGVARAAAATGPLITNIGRLSTQKAQRDLLDAMKLVLERHPTARLMIVGEGRLEQELKRQAAALGLADRVEFTGVRRDIPAVLAQTDVFTLSSRWEGLPLTVVEAMAAARPVVLTDVGGVRDLVDPGVHGLLVPPGEVPALANALSTLLSDDGLRRAMGQAGRERIVRDFSMDVYVERHHALYESLWAEGRRGRVALSAARGESVREPRYGE
ncbi:MAG TPA: glycosyltransferase [Gemmatimonadaceae bacterium]|nr:glycosyltransferase [Gemmatimonadaceae bacterium]